MSRRGLIWGVPVLLAIVAVYVSDPANSGLFPPCPTRAVLGVLCPGCGAQRALHCLLHGRIAEAWSLNPAAVVAVPYAGVGWVAAYLAPRHHSGARFRKTFYGRSAALLAGGGLVAWTIVRNLG